METASVQSIIDEHQDETQAAEVRGTLQFPTQMRVADLPCPIKADWLKCRPELLESVEDDDPLPSAEPDQAQG